VLIARRQETEEYMPSFSSNITHQEAVAKIILYNAVQGPIDAKAICPSFPTNRVSTKDKQGSISTAPRVGKASSQICLSYSCGVTSLVHPLRNVRSTPCRRPLPATAECPCAAASRAVVAAAGGWWGGWECWESEESEAPPPEADKGVGGSVVQSSFRCVASHEPLVRLLPPPLPPLLLLLPPMLLLLESDRCVMVDPLEKLVNAAVAPTSTVSCSSRCRRRIFLSCVYVYESRAPFTGAC